MAKRSSPRSSLSSSSQTSLVAQIHTCLDTDPKPIPAQVRDLARLLLSRSGGVVVSSTMALRTAITAFRASGDYDDDSPELTLLEAVFRLSEARQVPPRIVMSALAQEERVQSFAVAGKKFD
jgi:hypothetical protein